MTKILGLSGKKQSGKDTSAAWVIGQQMVASGLVSYIKIDTKGRLLVPAEVGGKIVDGIFDVRPTNKESIALLEQYVWPVVKLYSFADLMKESVINIFGLKRQQVYGTNEQYNEPTKYTWSQFENFLNDYTKSPDDMEDYMTGRDILQVFGTDIMRSIHSDIWLDACLNKIKQEQPKLAIITDVRFPNELKGVQKEGGKVIRLLRAPFSDQDEHESETALDNYHFDTTIDNRNMSIDQQCKEINSCIEHFGFDEWRNK